MIPLELDEVEARCPGRLARASGALFVTGVQIDSRRVRPGDLFVAVGPGEAYARAALAGGAAATLVPEDAFSALAALGRAVRDRSTARVVAITGSTGKTSTKDILAAICAPRARTVAAEASFNNELGVPLTLCRLETDTEIGILELAMRGLGQIAALADIARPDVGVITNVGPAHVELVGSLDAVVRGQGRARRRAPEWWRRYCAGDVSRFTDGRRSRARRRARGYGRERDDTHTVQRTRRRLRLPSASSGPQRACGSPRRPGSRSRGRGHG